MDSKSLTVVVTGDVMIDSKIASGHVYERESRRTEADHLLPGDHRTAPPHVGQFATGTNGNDDDDNDDAAPLFGPRVYLHRYVEAGGAISLYRIIRAALEQQPIRESVEPNAAPNLLRMRKTRIRKLQRSFWTANFVAGQYRRHGTRNEEDIKAVWRIKEKLGIDRTKKDTLDKLKVENFPLTYADVDKAVEDGGHPADLVIVDHLKQGFARHERFWPRSLKKPKPDAQLLVRWVYPQLDKNTKFWRDVQLRFGGRIVAVFAAEHLRLYGMQISRGLSWEKTVYELHERVSWMWNKALYGCSDVVVSFFPAGAVIFSSDVENWARQSADLFRPAHLNVTLVYDPEHIEGTWADGFDGDMMGSARCLAAGIALDMMLPNRRSSAGDPVAASTKLAHGVRAGLLAGRHVLIEGFAEWDRQERVDTALPKEMAFPVTTVARVFAGVLGQANYDKSPSPNGDVQKSEEKLNEWIEKESKSITISALRSGRLAPNWRLLDSSEDVAEKGPIAYAGDIVRYGATHRRFDFPTLRIGKLFITDRIEMETIRDVRELIVNYMSTDAVTAPLSIAVFGPPGSGKSFAIKELARDLSDDRQSRVARIPLEEVTFNVSQFAGTPSMASALHRVRDIGLAGKIPLVFWDEFDSNFESNPLGWLRFFLAPMQDGQFLDGFNLHNVGRAIFVFAGGTFSTMAGFNTGRSEDSAAEYEFPIGRLDHAAMKQAKLPDFISRLKGFVDVPTLNYRPGELDTSILLRRAELLRSFVRQTAPKLVQSVQRHPNANKMKSDLFQFVNIDQGVLEAFLRIPKYVYGARSMEAIVKMSTLSGKFLYDRSSLPPLDQLKLHVDAAEFAAIADEKWGPPPAPGRGSVRT